MTNAWIYLVGIYALVGVVFNACLDMKLQRKEDLRRQHKLDQQ